MFKNKLKLAKKLAILLTFGTAAVAATQNSAFAMGSTHAKKHHHHHKSAKPAAKKPAVFKPGELDILGQITYKSIDEEEVISQTQEAIEKGMKIEVSLSKACRCSKFKLARFLIENKLVDVDENVFQELGYSPIASIILSENIANPECFEFIQYLIEEQGAILDGMHDLSSSLVNVFASWARKKCSDAKIITQNSKQLVKIFEYLISKGMDVNGLFTKGKTLRYILECWEYEDGVPPYYNTIYRLVVKHGGKRYI